MTASQTQVAEQAIVDEILSRNWATKQQVESTREAIASKRMQGPLHKALFEQRLLKKNQVDRLEEFMHKDLLIGNFQVERKLGSGAMGDVFLASSTKEDKVRVALKVISKRFADDDSFVRRFDREIESLTLLEHPAIASAVDYGRHEGLPYLAMEYIDGPSLAQLLDKHGPLPETYALRVTMQIASGLDYVFNKTQLVHRDIKPENILVIPDEKQPDADLYNRKDKAVLIDFGLARSFTEDERLTMTGITMGTPHYMSPEQIRGAQDLDARSDIYAVGATMFHLVTGKTPYQGTSPGAVMTAHLTEEAPDPKQLVPGMSDACRNIILMSMSKEQDQRYQSFKAMAQACEEALAIITDGSPSSVRLLRKPLVLNKPSPKGNGTTTEHRKKNGTKRTENGTRPQTNGTKRHANGKASEVALPNLIDAPAGEEAEDELDPDDVRDRIKLKMKERSGRVDQLPDEDMSPLGVPVGEDSDPSRVVAGVAIKEQTNTDDDETANHPLNEDPEGIPAEALLFDESESKGGELDTSGTEALARLQSNRAKHGSGRYKRTVKKPAVYFRQRQTDSIKKSTNIGLLPVLILAISATILLAVFTFRYVLN